MIESGFHSLVGPEPERSSGDHFQLVVQAFDGTGRDLATGSEPVEDEGLVVTEAAGGLLHGLELRPHHLGAPAVQEDAGPVRRDVGPEELEFLPQEVATNGAQGVAHELGQLDVLLGRAILRPLEEGPACALQDLAQSLRLQLLGLLPADLVDLLVHVGHDVKAVQDVDRLLGLLGDDLEVGLPHVAADEAQGDGSLAAELAEETQHRLHRAVAPNPQETAGPLVDLVDHGEELAAQPQHFVDADRADSIEAAVRQAPRHDHLDRAEHALPSGVEGPGHLRPAHALRPRRQEVGLHLYHHALPVRPGYRLYRDATAWAVDAPHR